MLSRNNGYQTEPPRPITQSIYLYFIFLLYFQFIGAINTLVQEMYWSIMTSWHFWPEAELCNLIPFPLSSTQIMSQASVISPQMTFNYSSNWRSYAILLNWGVLSKVFAKWFKIHSAVKECRIHAFGVFISVVNRSCSYFFFLNLGLQN